MKRILAGLLVFMVLTGGCEMSPSRTTPPSGTPSSSPRISVDVFISNLDVPWAIDFAPDGRIFITERAGSIRIAKDGRLQDEPWMTLEVMQIGESGLLGLALDPDFEKNRYVYAAYTYGVGNELKNRLVRLKEDVASGKGVFDKILIDDMEGNVYHDGARVKFSPDGKLYVTMGEAGRPQLAQDLSSLNGKILRINSDGTIPSDNPFPNSPIYSYGHRNPQGLDWEPGTGRLYETEHGPSGVPGGRDEVNYIEPGKNYGWPVISGNETREGMESPVIQSGMSETWAPSGATFVTKGVWAGSFLFGGLRGESLYRLVLDKNNPRQYVAFERYFSGEYGRLREIVEGPDGALYVLTNNRDGRGNPRTGDDKLIRIVIR